ncbi:hypothetical protein [uncultured Shewanella sp.]|nr:hypothetical protein [uncultured Shewanella sp.]
MNLCVQLRRGIDVMVSGDALATITALHINRRYCIERGDRCSK